MAINFPTGPTDGQTYTENGSNWQYSVAAGGVWLSIPQTVAGPKGADGTSGTSGANGSNGLSPPLSMTIEFPTTTDKIPMIYTATPFTISEIRSVLQGTATPNVTFSIRYAPILSDTGTEVITGGVVCANTTYGQSNTTFNNATVNNWIWITTPVVTGTVNTLSVAVRVS
jgi:hypothetical protein